MDLVTKLKRKKLKTRKCLNELRKRLLGELSEDISKESNSVHINDSEEYFNTKPNSITMSRLRLGFLNKAVKSETITRHALSSTQEKTRKELFKNGNDINTMIFNESKASLHESSITSDKSNNSFTEIVTSRGNKHDLFYKATSKSPSLFSSLESSRTLFSSTEGSLSDSVENLHVTSLNSLKNDRKSFENSHSEKLSTEVIVEENPITYIKLGYTKHVAASHGGAVSTSMSRSGSPLCVSDTSHDSSQYVDDTPEYIYYPHRLNQ